MTRVLVVVLSAFLALPTVTSDAGTLAVPSFTPNTISYGGCGYALQVRAVDVTGDGFVDVLAGKNELGPCAAFPWLPCCPSRRVLLSVLCSLSRSRVRTEHSDPVSVRRW